MEYVQKDRVDVDVAIIGAGTAGLNAMKEVRKAGKSFVLIDHGPLGTTCARVGCMPSKAVLHAGAIRQGHVHGGGVRQKTNGDDMSPNALWLAARRTRDMLAEGTAKRTIDFAGEHLIMGHARFIGPNALEVDGRCVTARAFVIATGSHPVVPGFLHDLQDRVLTTDSLFELDALPASIGILGMGAIGLEIGLALSRLGVRVVAGDLKNWPAGIADPEIGPRATQLFGKEMTMWLGRKIEVRRAEGKPDQVAIGDGEQLEHVENLLAALGRKPAVEGLMLERTGIELGEHGLPVIDPCTMRVGSSLIYFAGDVDPDRPLMHEAADEGAIAGWNAARHAEPTTQGTAFQRRVPLGIVFSDPDIAAIGQSFDQLDPEVTLIGTALGQRNGRARILGAELSIVRIYARKDDGKLLGAALLATRGEHLAHLLAWAIQRGETAESLLEMPYYHPTMEEMLQSALTDIVKQRANTQAAIVGLRAGRNG